MGRSRLENAIHRSNDGAKRINSNTQERQLNVPVTAIASSVDEKIVIRSLRRRLCHAFMTENHVEALRIYTATRSEWENIVCREIAMAEAKVEERRKIHEDELKQQKNGSCNAISRLVLTKVHSQNSFQIDTSIEMKSLIDMARLEPSQENSLNFCETTALNEEAAVTMMKRNHNEGLLQILMNPSASFELDDYKTPYEPYDSEYDCPGSTTEAKDRQTPYCDTKKPDPPTGRQAFSFLRGSHRSNIPGAAPLMTTRDTFTEDDKRDRLSVTALPYQNESDKTTPLHEAARLGCYELVHAMLSSVNSSRFLVDCNIRCGRGRTILHCVAGGMTMKEADRYLSSRTNVHDKSNCQSTDQTLDDGIMMPVALQAAVPESPENNASISGYRSETTTNNKLKNAASAVGRFMRKIKFSKGEDAADLCLNRNKNEDTRKDVMPLSENEYLQLQMDRIETAKYILAWSHPDDGSSQSGMGVSSNAVDIQNRTALHYAAALGRADLCVLLCNHFGTMLTIVDNTSQTPCELAGANRWNDLAAQLEARALCYIDPYGTDEELLTSFTEGLYDNRTTRSGSSAAPPFYWFETLSSEKVQLKRKRRIEQSLEKFRQVMIQKQKQISCSHMMLDHVVANQLENDTVTQAVECDLSNFDDTTSFTGNQQSESSVFDFINFLDESHVECFLAFHTWNLKKALEAFNDDPHSALENASVPIPLIPTRDIGTDDDGHHIVDDIDQVCLICCETYDPRSNSWVNLNGCHHGFCRDCLGSYLLDCAKTKSTGLVVPCPHHDCKALLTRGEIKILGSSIVDDRDRSVYSILEDTANETFVALDPSFRFCPHPGCGNAVRFNAPSYSKTTKLIGTGLLELVGGVCTAVYGEDHTRNMETDDDPLTYEGVRDSHYFSVDIQPKRAHRFCFQCGEIGIHWPVACDVLQEWKEVVEKQVKDVANPEADEDYNDLAQKMWMKANTRPCPKVSKIFCILSRQVSISHV
jgi:hypothetical protein